MSAFSFEAGNRCFDFTGDRTYVMGVINLSPESNNRHTVADSPHEALAMAGRYRDHGAAIIDLGGQSSHFDNEELSPEEELERLLPALDLLTADGFVVSVDTWKPEVARRAIDAGAAIVNDTGGMRSESMVEVVRSASVPAVVTYVEGEDPLSVGNLEFIQDKAAQVAERFAPRLDDLRALGVTDLILDPGLSINYPSDYEEYTRQQLRVIRHLDVIRKLGHPVLIPVPRKRELARVMAYTALALEYGADIIRVHDVEQACDLVRLFGRDGS
ncbi:MAG: dihydropteroate synthase [Gammaproteobacteria bacterium]|nr:dihydropteroate synthase [Gammaproteobacteria bacterium]